MKNLNYLITYAKRLIYLLIIYSISRIFFYYINTESFVFVNIYDFIEGVRFDLSALAYINIPLILLLMFPSNLRLKKRYKQTINILFYITNIPFIILNNVDIEYFRFIQKRSTYDFIQMLQLGDDTIKILPQYIKDYWYITLITICQIWFLITIKFIPNNKIEVGFRSVLKETIIFMFSIGICVLMARGGLQLKPIKTINAGELSNSQNIGLILNTPFCILHSINENNLEQYKYYDKNTISNIYSPIHSKKDISIIKKNIIILIMESFSKEFIGYHNKEEKTWTPFLDSIMKKSLVFTNAYANGLKSIEALPAITASIPTLMDNPFITSKHAQNKFISLAHILKNEGYSTSFFHGGRRGTMGFYSFSKQAGFDSYIGLEEYNNNDDFDGSWGIFDEPFLKYFAESIKQEKKPFFTTFFSLSSHPPYSLPKEYKSEDSYIGILETVKYSDNAIKKFFNEIREEDWFKNTIFLITADHTSGERFNKKYKNKVGKYAIPMIIYKGDNSLEGINENIVQQIDIMPTILDMINYNKKYFAFGKSMFSKKQWAINKHQDAYLMITNNGIIENVNEDYITYKNWMLTEHTIQNQQGVSLLKAIKQNYNSNMINNNIYYED